MYWQHNYVKSNFSNGPTLADHGCPAACLNTNEEGVTGRNMWWHKRLHMSG
jgi:hypothetical protein